MSPDPPPETSLEQDEGLGTESREASETGARGKWTIRAVLGVLVVAGGVAGFLFLSSEPHPPTGQVGPARGLACPYLRRGADAYERENRAAYDQEIARAAEVAEDTLQISGQLFGEPERIALEISLGNRRDASALLLQAEVACSRVGR
jgi:hypothetical protein